MTLMQIQAVAIVLALAACGGASYQTVQLANKTARPIEEIYIFPMGATNHGASRGSLAPNATTEVRVKTGRIEVLGVSSKIQLDERTRDQLSASITIELAAEPARVWFYDADAPPAGLDQPNVRGVAFKLPRRAAPTEPAPEPVVE